MNENFPSDLEGARERVERALARLEELVAKAAQGGDARTETLAAELAALKADHESLGVALQEAEADYAALRQVTDTVTGRLDATIDQLKSVLES